MADGCGNQQEFFYLGQPYLIMRTAVEKNLKALEKMPFVLKGTIAKSTSLFQNIMNTKGIGYARKECQVKLYWMRLTCILEGKEKCYAN